MIRIDRNSIDFNNKGEEDKENDSQDIWFGNGFQKKEQTVCYVDYQVSLDTSNCI